MYITCNVWDDIIGLVTELQLQEGCTNMDDIKMYSQKDYIFLEMLVLTVVFQRVL